MEMKPEIVKKQISQLELKLKQAFDSGKAFYEKKKIIQDIHSLQNELNFIADPINHTRPKPMERH
jgi:hypothetical protein